MSLALRIEYGEIDGWRQRHRLDLLAGRAAIGLGRLLMRLSIAVAVRRSLAWATMVPGGGGSGASENFAAGNRG